MSAVTRRSLRANSLLALAGDLIGKAGLLVVLMVSARLLSLEQFALLGVCIAIYGVCASVLDAGSSLLIQRDGAMHPERRRPLFEALLRARAPYAIVFVVGAIGAGVVWGDPLAALAIAAASIVAALTLSLWAVIRASEDFRPETAQRLGVGALGMAGALVGAAFITDAWAVIVGLALGGLALVPWIWRAVHRASAPGPREPAHQSLMQAIPLGALSIATLVYYRAPTVVLGVLGTALATGQFTAAATVAFGLLALPNAISSGLLPRLASTAHPEDRTATLRAALGWTLICAFVSCVAVAGVGPLVLQIGFGSDYRSADPALSILLLATIMIAASSVVGAALIAAGQIRWLVVQVSVSLAANLALALTLVPRFGAEGAAVATLISEAIALAILAPVGTRSHPGLWHIGIVNLTVGVLAAATAIVGVLAGGAVRPVACALACIAVAALAPQVRSELTRRLRILGALRLSVICGLVAFAGLWLWATLTDYGLRVISDSPSFLVIVRALAARPLHSVNPFLAQGEVANSHATPYTQLLGLGWRALGIDDLADPYDVHPQALYRYLAVCGLLVVGLVLHSVFVFVRSQAGSQAAWWSIPALLVLFGPAHVIWAGDLSFHSFLYGAFFPQNLAIALCLYTVTILRTDSLRRIAAGCLLAGGCLVVHPFTGSIMALLLAILGAQAGFAGQRRWWRFALAFAVGGALGWLWPVYSLNQALAESGAQGWVIALGVAVISGGAHLCGRYLPQPRRWKRLGGSVLERLARPRTALVLAIVSLVVLAALVAWQLYLTTQPNPDPLIHSNRLSVYWVEDRWRWPLMFAVGLAGVSGLARLALRGLPLCALWALATMGAGLAGIAGAPVPVWWRFLLFAQVPIACGLASVLAEAGPILRRLIVSGMLSSLAMKLVILLALSSSLTYFASELQPSWSLGKIIPQRAGVVVSDPFSSYLVSPASGHRVLSVTKSHVGSKRELAASEAGYALLHEFHSGQDWWQAAQRMYRDGIRFVLVEKSTSLKAPDLVTFSTGPTPLVRTPADRAALGQYYYRLNQVGRLLYDRTPYALYELDEGRLFPGGELDD